MCVCMTASFAAGVVCDGIVCDGVVCDGVVCDAVRDAIVRDAVAIGRGILRDALVGADIVVVAAQVSATFAASLVTSPALGAYLSNMYSDSLVVALATAIAVLDILFVMVCVPESLPEKVRPASWGSQISWDKADPFGVGGARPTARRRRPS